MREFYTYKGFVIKLNNGYTIVRHIKLKNKKIKTIHLKKVVSKSTNLLNLAKSYIDKHEKLINSRVDSFRDIS
jgi:hypothetical protein